jgi:hypothetical protein
MRHRKREYAGRPSYNEARFGYLFFECRSGKNGWENIEVVPPIGRWTNPPATDSCPFEELPPLQADSFIET